MAAKGPKMADRFWEGVCLLVFGRSRQLSLTKFFDLSTPFLRKGCDEGNARTLTDWNADHSAN